MSKLLQLEQKIKAKIQQAKNDMHQNPKSCQDHGWNIKSSGSDGMGRLNETNKRAHQTGFDIGHKRKI